MVYELIANTASHTIALPRQAGPPGATARPKQAGPPGSTARHNPHRVRVRLLVRTP